jgi:hypothetical protein
MSKLNIFILMIVLSLFTACGQKEERNIKSEKYFTDKVEKLLQKSDKIETDFTDLVNFEWEKVCFTDGSRLLLRFHDLKTDNQYTIQLSKNYNIEEEYVKDSPIQEHYEKKVLSSKNCWKKNTLFIIKKWNTTKKDDLLIQIKGA